MDIQKIRKSVEESNIIWHKHSLERMMKRGIHLVTIDRYFDSLLQRIEEYFILDIKFFI